MVRGRNGPRPSNFTDNENVQKFPVEKLFMKDGHEQDSQNIFIRPTSEYADDTVSQNVMYQNVANIFTAKM